MQPVGHQLARPALNGSIVICLTAPPARQEGEDMPYWEKLQQHFLTEANTKGLLGACRGRAFNNTR